MYFGIELEYFIVGNHGELPNNLDINKFYSELIGKGFVKELETIDKEIYSLSIQTKHGRIRIKNDFYSHILELEFPPTYDVYTFSEMYHLIMEVIVEILERNRFKLHDKAYLKTIPSNLCLRLPEKDYQRLQRVPIRPLPDKLLSFANFNSAIAATHIHFNYTPSLFKRLKNLYAIEYLIPAFFSNSKEFMGIRAHCIRPLVWRDNFIDSLNLVAFPRVIPWTKNAYKSQIEGMSNSGFKDYSLITPRFDLNTVEFRGACSLNSLPDILNLISLRIAILGLSCKFNLGFNDQTLINYYATCKENNYDRESFLDHVFLLKTQINKIENGFKPYLTNVLSKLEAHSLH
jgi:hypothetical protein